MEMRVRVGDFTSPWLPVEDFDDVDFEARPIYPMVHVKFLNRVDSDDAYTRGPYRYRTEKLLKAGDLVLAGPSRQLCVVLNAMKVTHESDRPFAQHVEIETFNWSGKTGETVKIVLGRD
jgi:hypothetical protein